MSLFSYNPKLSSKTTLCAGELILSDRNQIDSTPNSGLSIPLPLRNSAWNKLLHSIHM